MEIVYSLSVAYLITVTLALPSAATFRLCHDLHARIPTRVSYDPNGPHAASNLQDLIPHYEEAQGRYWSGGNQDDFPACIMFPSSAEDVSIAIKLLNASPTVPFAMKSGGHDWNRGWSSIHDGLLISFRPFSNYTKLSDDGFSAEIGPGARWGEVMEYLDPFNKSVVGGRVDDVGVGGLVIKGGLSYLSSQYGFASDNVINYEVVLANGDIVNANATSNSDLFFALRGGGNSFGAVTKFTLTTHNIFNVWGGMRIYSNDKAPQLISAITNFIANYQDTKASLIPTIVWPAALNGSDIWTVFFFYDGEIPPNVGNTTYGTAESSGYHEKGTTDRSWINPFSEFDAIAPIPDEALAAFGGEALAQLAPRIQRYKDILGVSDAANQASGSGPTTHKSDAFSSLPNLPHKEMVEFIKHHYEQAINSSFLHQGGVSIFNMALQVIPTALQEASYIRGPAALSTNPAHGDKIWIEYGLQWNDEKLDYTLPLDLMLLVDAGKLSMKNHYGNVLPTHWKGGSLETDPYSPIFANDAHAGQMVLKSYGEETYAYLRKVSAKYDPEGLFVRRTRGYKF